MPAALLLLVLLSLGPILGNGNLSDELLLGLQRAASYLERAHLDFNLDAFIGYRFLNARINEICAPEQEISLRCQTLQAIKRTTSNLTDQSMTSVKLQDILYFIELQQIIQDNFWKPSSSWAETNPTLVYSEMNNPNCHPIDVIRECTSYILIGSKAKNLTACSVPEHCREYMTQPGCSGYFLSHQIFYSMIASAIGCIDPLFIEEISDYNNIFCANMMKVNQMIEEINFPFMTQDLFAENIMYCGMVGFSDFLKLEWLKRMLSWQDPDTGCFGTIKDETSPSASKEVLLLILGDQIFLDFENYLAAEHKKENAMSKHRRNGSHRRVKRNERLLKGGCLSHMTGVLVGALAQFLVKY